MLITADTLTKMFSLITKDDFFEDVLHKFLSNKNERNEFRQELHLTICEMPKAIEYWNSGVFNWVYLSIIKRSIQSSNSRWHYKYRKKEYDLFEDFPGFQPEDLDFNDDDTQIKELKEQKFDQISASITKHIKQNPVLIRDFNLFNKYYNEGKTYRQISAETKIPLMSCHIYIKNARELIQQDILNNNKQLNN